MDQEDRLKEISRCVDELNFCRTGYPNKNAIIATLGQLDWLEELRTLLYEEKK